MKRLSAALAAVLLAGILLCACMPKNRPVLRVAMSPDFAPMEFVDPTRTGQASFVGFDVSLAKYLANGLDMNLQIVPMSFEACQDAVESGEVHMAISGFSWLPQRQERFNLSVTYHAGENSANQVLLTALDDHSRFDSPESFQGVRVGAQSASLQEWLVSQQLPGAVIVTFSTLDEGLSLLQQGDIEALAVAEGNANTILAASGSLAMAVFRFHVTDELTDNLILLPKGADELTQAVNELLLHAESAGYYPQWYAQALRQAGVELHYDDEGHPAKTE